ncbi:MAG: hypothetical protein PHT88_00055 [Candidatus Moranbacteria bacterium]|nr:hypothetical protein [Candidatus Moranbacteria bacterium]
MKNIASVLFLIAFVAMFASYFVAVPALTFGIGVMATVLGIAAAMLEKPQGSMAIKVKNHRARKIEKQGLGLCLGAYRFRH